MTIRDIVEFDKKRNRVIIDDKTSFVLYKGEIKHLDLFVSKQIDEQLYREIKTILLKRCKERALFIIERNRKTKKEIIIKLRQSGYSDDLIDSTLAFLERYNYIDDRRYVEDYIRSKMNTKSIRNIEYDLYRKGISSGIVKQISEEIGIDSKKLIVKLLNSRKYNINCTQKEINSHIRYLLGKGFKYDDIISCIEEFEQFS